MPEYLNLVREVSKMRAAFGKQMQPPCTLEEMALLQDEAMAELGLQVPQDYLDFLRLHDGLVWNGLYLYASHECPLVGHPNATIPGMVEVNLIRREVPGWSDQHLCLADTGDDSYGMRLTDGRFCGVDMVSG